MESKYDLLILKTDQENARLLDIELARTEYSFLRSFSTELLVEKKDVENVRKWFADRDVDCIVFAKSRVIDDTMETFNVHPDWFDMSHDQAMLYEYIANKYDFKTMDIDMRRLRNEVEGLIYKEEKEFCRDNGIYDNYDWELYERPFLKHGHEYLRPTLMVKILNEKGYRQVKGDDIDHEKDFAPFFGVYVRKETVEQEKKVELDSRVKEWYLKEFPEDVAAEGLHDDVTFKDVVKALNEGNYSSSTLGVHDHTVRQHVFDEIANLLYVSRDVVMNKYICRSEEPDLAIDTVAHLFTINPEAMPDYRLISIEECMDESYGASIVQFSMGDELVCFAFSCIGEEEALERPELVLAELVRNGVDRFAPSWSNLSEELLGLIVDSAFDMKFVEHDDDWMTEEMADEIWEEAIVKGLDSVVTRGEDHDLITVYAGAMGAVNWKNHEEFGKPCLEKKFDVIERKRSLSEQVKAAVIAERVNDTRASRDTERML